MKWDRSMILVFRQFEERDFDGMREIYPEFFEDRPELRFEEGFIVAEMNERIVGFVVITTHRTYPWWDRKVRSWGEIVELDVHHELWRIGIGTQLILKAVEYGKSKSVEAIYVLTGEDNIPARNLYEKNGFKEYERKTRYKISLKQSSKEYTWDQTYLYEYAKGNSLVEL